VGRVLRIVARPTRRRSDDPALRGGALKVAALYDVHGNVHALEAVLAEVDADVVLFGGDLASGPFPAETIELARSLPDARFVRGNADVLASPTYDAEADAARRWVERQLDEERIAWLATLPFSAVFDDTLYVHANPRNVEDVVTELTPGDDVARYLDGVTESRVVTGHVHLQFTRHVGRVDWIGAGSVGYPYEDEPGAYWALLTPDEVEFRCTEYDYESCRVAIESSGHPRAAALFAARPKRTEALAFLTA
jgi:predicted phosphodiesterase